MPAFKPTTSTTDLDNWIDPAIAETGPESPGPSAVPGVTVGAALTQALYLTEAGDTTAITARDIHQGQIGDCFLVSAIGELAMRHPDAIRNMIHQNTDGTETVALFATKTGGIPNVGATALKAISVTVNNVFPTYSVNS